MELIEDGLTIYLKDYCDLYGIEDLKSESLQIFQGGMVAAAATLGIREKVILPGPIPGSIAYNPYMIISWADRYIFCCMAYNKPILKGNLYNFLGISHSLIPSWAKDRRRLVDDDSFVKILTNYIVNEEGGTGAGNIHNNIVSNYINDIYKSLKVPIIGLNELSTLSRSEVDKLLNYQQELSLMNFLNSPGQQKNNPIGTIATLNHHHGWNATNQAQPLGVRPAVAKIELERELEAIEQDHNKS